MSSRSGRPMSWWTCTASPEATQRYWNCLRSPAAGLWRLRVVMEIAEIGDRLAGIPEVRSFPEVFGIDEVDGGEIAEAG